MLIKHVRDDMRNPVATIVAIKDGDYPGLSIGIAICNPVDVFNKKFGTKIAYGRAKNRKGINIPTNRYVLYNNEYVNLFDVMVEELGRMAKRVMKYYLKENKNVSIS